MSLRPRSLPKLRDQTLRHLLDPEAPIRKHTGEQQRAGLDMLVNRLRVAELFWVTEDMAALAMSAGASLDTLSWATSDRPAPFGLMVFAGGIGTANLSGVEVPIDACAWGPSPGGCTIDWLTDRRRVAEIIARRGDELITELVPPLIPAASSTVAVTEGPDSSVDVLPDAPSTLACLGAAWLLMQQPTLAERWVERPEKAMRKAYARAGLADPEVSVIDLRRLYVPQGHEPDEESPGRTYKHRWVVSGHWRNAWRPSVQEHRRVWIPSYLKGPDGAPLLVTERVNVWRR